MKTHVIWLCSLAAGSLLWQPEVRAQFEGIVESKNLTVDETDRVQEYVMTICIGSGMMRVHNSAIGTTPPSTMIYRNDKGVFWVLNEQDKTYIEVLQNPEEEKAPAAPVDGKEKKPVLKKSGRKKKILGYLCEQYMVRRPGESTEIWGTKALPGLVRAMATVTGGPQAEAGESWSDELTKMGVYPLAARTKVEGKTVESQEVTRIERRALSKDLFELPQGYTREQVEGGVEKQ